MTTARTEAGLKGVMGGRARTALVPARYLLLLCALLLSSMPTASRGGEAELERLMEKMERDALEYAAVVEAAYGDRCSEGTLGRCSRAHFHECDSLFPDQSCLGGDGGDGDGGGGSSFTRLECTVEGGSCSGLYDFTVSNVRMSEHVKLELDGNPRTADVKEALCYSLQTEQYMIEKFHNERSYWASYGLEPPQSHFGAENGAFRIYPARQSTDDRCGRYDTTLRPWYVAATSGPKDVVLVLDVSGSMAQRGRLRLMKDAAIRVIDTLAVGDHVGIVTFNESVGFVSGANLVQANDHNKKLLRNVTASLEAGGSTNFLDAFDRAFDMLAESRRIEESSDCHSAILFLTDGKMSAPENVTARDVIDLIHRREDEVGVEPYIFMYGLGASAQYGAAAEDPKRIACATGGMWSFVQDGGDLTSAMTNYYKLFALGLGVDENEGFVAWVQPYAFHTSGFMGTSVSAPVYDRTVTPHVLLGAVGIDFFISAMDEALGVEAGSRETLERLAKRSTAICPRLDLDGCAIQSLRREAGGDEALCPDECADFVGIQPKLCGAASAVPTDFFDNIDNRGKTFEERTCCIQGEARRNGSVLPPSMESDSRQCVLAAEGSTVLIEDNTAAASNSEPTTSLPNGIIALIVILAIAFVVMIVSGCVHIHKRHSTAVEREQRLQRVIENLLRQIKSADARNTADHVQDFTPQPKRASEQRYAKNATRNNKDDQGQTGNSGGDVVNNSGPQIESPPVVDGASGDLLNRTW